MIKHYLKIALRNLARQKVLAGINIFGLSIGIACFSLFLLYTVYEFSFDRFHQNKDRLFRVIQWWDKSGTPGVGTPVAPALKKDFADVEYAVRLRGWGDQVKVNNEVFRMGVTLADPDFFKMFSFPLLYGNAATALNDLHSVVITKDNAIQLFGTADAVGKQLAIKIDTAFVPFTVSGVAENIPDNSTIRFNIIGNLGLMANDPMMVESMNKWTMTIGITAYVQLKPGSRLHQEPNRLALFKEKYLPEAAERQRALKKGRPFNESSYRLQPIRDVHTNTAIEDTPVDPKNLWLLIGIAAGVLLIACINFTTLAIGRSASRAKEVGVRKVLGGQREQLIKQFLAESILLSVVSTTIGLLLAYLILPYFNQLAGTKLTFSLQQLPEMGWLLAGLTVLVGVLAGSYPALVLSGFRTIEVLKSKIKVGGSNLFTRSLVTLQFVLSTGLIIATVIILQQVSFLRNKNLGFAKENVVSIHLPGEDAKKIYPLFKQSIQSQTGIAGVTASAIGLGADEGQMGGRLTIDGKEGFAMWFPVDNNYLNILDVKLLAGNYLTDQNGYDAAVVNEALVQEAMGIPVEQAIGKQITGLYNDSSVKTIVGVVKDMNYENLSRKVRPQLLYLDAHLEPTTVFVRLSPGDPSRKLAAIEAAWKKLMPGLPFQYHFLDEKFDNFYRSEKRWSAIVGWAGAISIFLACLGLFGLAALAVVNRTREIGIRKVLGASVTQIAGLLSKDFVRLVIIALLIASPIAWYVMNNWLQSYAYRIDINVLVFMLAGLFAVGIAVLTVGAQAIKAAVQNPVNSLRTE